MNVLMYGWEFPPYNQGGLGTACQGLSLELAKKDVQITFVLPALPEEIHEHNLDVIPAQTEVISINSPLSAYLNKHSYFRRLQGSLTPNLYGQDLFEEVERYAAQAGALAAQHPHDVIHAHDWLTFKAGITAKKISGKPLIVHVHATEFDRTGGGNGGINHAVYDIELRGMHAADKVIAVSNFTKQLIRQHYGIAEEKINVLHNGITPKSTPPASLPSPLKTTDTIVLFLGRLTLQKGPDYFLKAAKRVLDHDPRFLFVIAGNGDMQGKLLEEAAKIGIAHKVLFTGFLRGEEVEQAYRLADLYVMPSVSEPFGIAPLEAINNGTPCIISKQSGVSEVLHHCLKVDFWDTEKLAQNIISLTHYLPAHETMARNAHQEIKKLTWEKAAEQCLNIYHSMTGLKTVTFEAD